MKKIKIGIPRTNMYDKYGVFWKHFFLCLNCKIILSPKTNNKIINNGYNNLSNYNCLKNKIYFGHIKTLSNSCDYIFIYSTCHNLSTCINYKLFLENIKKHLLPSQILLFNPAKNKFIEALKIAIKLTKNPLRILYAYLYAIKKQENYNTNNENNQINKLNNDKNKILLISNNEDDFIKEKIMNYLNQNNITTLFSNYLSKKKSLFFTKYIHDKYINKYTKELLGPAYYYQYSIKAIIYLKTDNCILDDYLYENIKDEIKNIIIIKLESNSPNNIENHLELLIETINNHK